MFKNSPKVVFVDAGFTITRGVPVTEKIDYLLKNWLTIKRPANESLMNNLFAELLDRRATGCEWKDSSYNIVTAENPDDETAAVLRLLGMTNGSDHLLMGISSGRLGLQTDHERQKQMPPKSLEDLLSHTRMFFARNTILGHSYVHSWFHYSGFHRTLFDRSDCRWCRASQGISGITTTWRWCESLLYLLEVIFYSGSYTVTELFWLRSS